MVILWRRLSSPHKLFVSREGGLSLVVRGASSHRRAFLAKPRMRLREGYAPELHVGISPNAQLAALRMDRDEQVAVFSVTLVRDPDDDFPSRQRLRA